MTYDFAYGDRAYSSWSLRVWLLLDHFGISYRGHSARLYSDDLARVLSAFAPARTVPAIKTSQGTVIADTAAITEELASRHPDLPIWPTAPADRGTARMLVAEMHSSFAALRSECPMNLRVAYRGFDVGQSLAADLARIEVLWAHARSIRTEGGAWLFGTYSAADAFFAPVAARIAGYGLPVGPEAQNYVAAALTHPSFRRWRAMALNDGPDQPVYAMAHDRRAWPGPAPRAAMLRETGPSENTLCPYSGKAVTHFLELEGRVFGFCNAFCRDKTLSDPEAWPAFMALVDKAD